MGNPRQILEALAEAHSLLDREAGGVDRQLFPTERELIEGLYMAPVQHEAPAAGLLENGHAGHVRHSLEVPA
ncbi:MAG: hypothetical protein WEB00_07525 [Dehalococcoidia bacterium]